MEDVVKMKNQSLAANVMKISIEDSIHKVMDIIEKEDGRTFEEKKKEAINFLKDKENTLLAERLIDIATNDEMGKPFLALFRTVYFPTDNHERISPQSMKTGDW